MKNIFFMLGLLFVINAQADIEYNASEYKKASESEIRKSRACFKDLETFGCGDPSDDHQHFRSCMNNIYSGLSIDCKKMMSELYGTKK